MLVAVLILACYAKYCEMLPLQGSPTAMDHLGNEEFLISNGITQEEIEEFHRTSTYLLLYIQVFCFQILEMMVLFFRWLRHS